MTEKLQIIEESLANLGDQIAIVAHNTTPLRLAPEQGYFSDMGQDVVFRLAPHEPNYKAKSLENLRKLIAPDLKADYEERFWRSMGTFRLGYKFYTEQIGTAHVKGTTDFDSQTTYLADDYTPHFEFDAPVERSITVRLFPDVRIAANFDATVNGYYMGTDEVRRAKRTYARFGEWAAKSL